MAEDEEPGFRAAMNEFVATVTEAVDISAFAGHVRLAAGCVYRKPHSIEEEGESRQLIG